MCDMCDRPVAVATTASPAAAEIGSIGSMAVTAGETGGDASATAGAVMVMSDLVVLSGTSEGGIKLAVAQSCWPGPLANMTGDGAEHDGQWDKWACNCG